MGREGVFVRLEHEPQAILYTTIPSHSIPIALFSFGGRLYCVLVLVWLLACPLLVWGVPPPPFFSCFVLSVLY